MQKIICRGINLEKDKWDYCVGLASIHATTTTKIIRSAIDLCFKNNEVFTEFLKNTLENERLENERKRAEKSLLRNDASQYE